MGDPYLVNHPFWIQLDAIHRAVFPLDCQPRQSDQRGQKRYRPFLVEQRKSKNNYVGAGYRVYFIQDCDCIFLLLIGGDKSTQRGDIAEAIEMAKERRASQ